MGRDLIPAPARRYVYLGLIVANVVVAIWAPQHVATVTAVASALGLTLATGNVPSERGPDGP